MVLFLSSSVLRGVLRCCRGVSHPGGVRSRCAVQGGPVGGASAPSASPPPPENPPVPSCPDRPGPPPSYPADAAEL